MAIASVRDFKSRTAIRGFVIHIIKIISLTTQAGARLQPVTSNPTNKNLNKKVYPSLPINLSNKSIFVLKIFYPCLTNPFPSSIFLKLVLVQVVRIH